MKFLASIAAVLKRRAALAIQIRALTKGVAVDSLAMGKKLKVARDTFPVVKGHGAQYSRPGWEAWEKKEVGLSMTMINHLINMGERFGKMSVVPKVSRSVLITLAQPKVPEAAVREVTKRATTRKVTEREAREIIGRATKGGITKKEIKKISAFHAENAPPLPKPREAQKQARESGEFTLASDGYYYSPATN